VASGQIYVTIGQKASGKGVFLNKTSIFSVKTFPISLVQRGYSFAITRLYTSSA